MAVGVQADGRQVGPSGGPELVAEPKQIVRPAGGLPIAAEDDLGILAQVLGQNLGQDSLLGRFLLEPQAPQGGGLLVPDAEHAVTVTAVGHVNIESAEVVIGHNIPLHEKHLPKNPPDRSVRLLWNGKERLAILRGGSPIIPVIYP